MATITQVLHSQDKPKPAMSWLYRLRSQTTPVLVQEDLTLKELIAIIEKKQYSYKELQDCAKEMGVKANSRRHKLVRDIACKIQQVEAERRPEAEAHASEIVSKDAPAEPTTVVKPALPMVPKTAPSGSTRGLPFAKDFDFGTTMTHAINGKDYVVFECKRTVTNKHGEQVHQVFKSWKLVPGQAAKKAVYC